MRYRYCGAFSVKERLFVCREERVGGPRVTLLPPRELDTLVDDETLGAAIEAALQGYRDAGRRMARSEWEAVSHDLLSVVGADTISAFERKKRDVTVRVEPAIGEVHLVGHKGRAVTLERPTGAQL